MTKQEYKYKVKEMLNMCLDPTSDCRDKCDYCDYNCCQDYLCRDALFVIEDLELELKQAKIDVLNSFAEKLKNDMICIAKYEDGTTILQTSNKLIDQCVKIFINEHVEDVQNDIR